MSDLLATDNGLARLSLKEAFNKAAVRALNDFPHRIDNLYLASLTEPIYISPEAARILRENAAFVQEVIDSDVEYMRKKGTAGLASQVLVGRKTMNFIYIANDENSLAREAQIYVSGKFSTTADLISVLDHELGHRVVEEGSSAVSSKHIAECAADAYAALRHIQRFGDKTDFFEYAPFTRTRTIVNGRTSTHYTAAVIQKIDRLRQEVDITALSPRQTAELAGKVAREYAFSEQVVQKIKQAFHPVKEYLAQNSIGRLESFKILPGNNTEYFRILIGIMREHKDDHDIYRAGKMAVSKHIEAMKAESVKDPFWNEALTFMEQHEQDSDIILNQAAAMDATRRDSSPSNMHLASRPR